LSVPPASARRRYAARSADQPIGSVEGPASFPLRPGGAIDRAELAQRVLFARQRQELLADGQERLAWLLRVQRFGTCEAAHHALGAFVDHRLEEPFLGREVAVDRHLGNAGVGSDRVDAGPLQSMRIEVVARGFQDAPAALGVARPAALRLRRGIVFGLGHLIYLMYLTVQYR
jgi:hypothetical protein